MSQLGLVNVDGDMTLLKIPVDQLEDGEVAFFDDLKKEELPDCLLNVTQPLAFYEALYQLIIAHPNDLTAEQFIAFLREQQKQFPKTELSVGKLFFCRSLSLG